jgi:hypothetical protein
MQASILRYPRWLRLKLSGFGVPAAAIAAFCAILVAVAWVATMQRIEFERAEAIRDATGALAKLAIAYEEHSLRTLKEVDEVLSLIKDEYERRDRRSTSSG